MENNLGILPRGVMWLDLGSGEYINGAVVGEFESWTL